MRAENSGLYIEVALYETGKYTVAARRFRSIYHDVRQVRQVRPNCIANRQQEHQTWPCFL